MGRVPPTQPPESASGLSQIVFVSQRKHWEKCAKLKYVFTQNASVFRRDNIYISPLTFFVIKLLTTVLNIKF